MRHAVLAQQAKGDYYKIITDMDETGWYAPSLEILHQAMEDQHITTLWVMPGCMFSQQIRSEHFHAMDKQLYDAFVPEQGVRQGRPYGARIRFNRQNAYDRFFMFPENREWKAPHAKDKGIWYVPEPRDLLTTVEYLQKEYKTNIIWSPSYVALDRLREIHRIQERNIRPLPQEQRERFTEIARQCCNWIAWTTRNPITKKYLVGYDKNAQFLGASGSVQLGNGGYVEASAYAYPCVGFFHYRLVDWTRTDFPCPLDKPEGYAHTDLIEAARTIGANVNVYSGIVWFEHDKYLNTWAKDMWQHRSNLRTLPQYDDMIARNNALSTAKLIPNSMIGRFATDAGEEYEHPDWNRAIVNRATANQVYSLNKMVRDFGIELVLVSKDAFYIQTEHEMPKIAIPHILDYENEQRGYKAIGTAEMNESIAAAFQRVDDKRFGVTGVEQEIKRGMR